MEKGPPSPTGDTIANAVSEEAPNPLTNGMSVQLMEKLVQTLITALEGHINSKPVVSSTRSWSKSRRSSHDQSSVISDEPAHDDVNNHDNLPGPLQSARQDTLPIPEVEPFKNRIGRDPPYPTDTFYWVPQHVWESYRPPQRLSGRPVAKTESMAVLYQVYNDTKWLSIVSLKLIAAFNKVNKHPRLGYQWHHIVEIEPFPSLFYHLDDIRAEIEATHDENAKLDFQALEFISREFEQRWQDAREENTEDGLCSHKNLWKLYNPGDLVVRTDELGSEWLFVLIQLKPQESGFGSMDFVTWGLSWDSLDSLLERKIYTFRVLNYEGRRRITELPVYPLEQKGSGKEEFLKKLADRGRKWQELMVAPQSVRMHDGLAMPEGTRRRRDSEDSDDGKRPDFTGIRKLKERVIIDEDSKTEQVRSVLGEMDGSRTSTPGPPPPPPPPPGMRPGGPSHAIGEGPPGPSNPRGFNSHNFSQPPPPGSQPQSLKINVPGIFTDAGDLDQREDYRWDGLPGDTVLTDEQAQLCPAVIGGVSIASEHLYSISVENLEPVKWNKGAMERLVLDEDKKDLLKGLVAQHSHRARTSEFGDLIENKGKGLVILLHGPPGVGKTLTAECVGEWVGKPLIALSIGDLIVDESQLERRLIAEFERALKWDAILLLDEADVVIEARSFEDVRRNGIVSVFLRQLEYFQGVLFLTTNRISTMDVAFQSRIQVALGFDDLKPRGRSKIWEGLLKSRQKTIDADAFEEIMKKVHSLANANLNGRQIRNALNIAEGYAFNELGKPGMLNFSHIQNAVKAAEGFQKFFDKARENSRSQNSVWAPYEGASDSD